MIPTPLPLTPRGISRLTGIALALLAALLFAALVSAQPAETPIVIGDGSLTMESGGVPWSGFTGPSGNHSHPNHNGKVKSVDVFMAALSHTLDIGDEKVEVIVTYAGSFPITVVTNGVGRNVQVKTDFTQFHQGATANHLSHNKSDGVITHVTVNRAGSTVFDSGANGHTRVVIHLQ